MADYQSLDVLRQSASTEQTPDIRIKTEVAKLIDVSKCIGCKACQVACEEWNDLRDDIGFNEGVYTNPPDLSAKTWTLRAFPSGPKSERMYSLSWAFPGSPANG